MECIEAFAKHVKKESDEMSVQLSPSSGLVRHTIQDIGEIVDFKTCMNK